MKNYLVYFVILISFLPLLARSQESEWGQIKVLLNKQLECWNDANLECFMEAYWKSDSLKFIGKNGVVYGWGPTLERYTNNYPDKASMGRLEFDLISWESVGLEAYFVVGKFHLLREIGDLEGHFSLLWRKIGDEWKIVADHTSG